MEKKDLTNSSLSKNLVLEVNFKGQEFEKFVEISNLNKKLVAIDKAVKNSIDALKKTRKIKNKTEIVESIQIDLRRNSIDNIILISFISPIVATIIGNLVVDYIRYLAKEKINKTKEFDFLDKNISNLNQINNLISIKDINSKIEIKFENNYFVVSNNENQKIQSSIRDIKDSFEIKDIEDTIIGKIEKLDRGKDVYHITIEGYPKKVSVTFQNYLDDEELREILFHRLLVDAVLREKNGEFIAVHILDYKILRPKTIKDYDEERIN